MDGSTGAGREAHFTTTDQPDRTISTCIGSAPYQKQSHAETLAS
jgi:hypothetical protein